mgnify:CR=1 FL=1
MDDVKLTLLKDTLDREFSIEKFQKFTREFFNEPDVLPSRRDERIWLEYKNSIEAYYKIASYIDNEKNSILILAVELKRGSAVERARSLQRNFISKVLDGSNYEAAIVAFYTPNEPNWRLSLVRLDYTLTTKGVELDLTPAKRFSYLVGENEPKHTVIKQLFTIFKDDKRNPSLDEIEEAFSVEKVTKDFFNEYKDKYLELKEYLEKNEEFIDESNKLGLDVNKFAEQFTKKLMGQLAFLYFLQKKGWLGVRILPENRELTRIDYQQIYNSVESQNKKVLLKVFRETPKGTVVALADDLHLLNDHEAGLLSDCFVNTKYDMPWGTGDKNFIRGLFDFCEEKTNLNFFNDYLEPFFYEALNRKRKNNYFKRFNCKIPFLNGGLFEPIEKYHWRDVNFEIPNNMFSNKNEKGRYATGILDIFDMYNFTMNEDEPLEKEVAIDPEMLGKIFENLLEVSDRKSKGAFYTPREIVYYMCQESLINYLVNKVKVPYEDVKEFILYGEMIRDEDSRRTVVREGAELTIKPSIYENIVAIDEALRTVKIADPAVGSGAFPLGMLNEIVKARNNITEYIVKVNREGQFGTKYDERFIRARRSEYKMKWDTIKNSIFAVDIEPSAVDIAKLRLWLSVVVDQEIDENNPEPHPLPNLDQNIMVGNSLIDEFEGIKLFDESLLNKQNNGNNTPSNFVMQMNMLLDQSDELLDTMFKLQDRYFGEDAEANKKEIKDEIDRIQDQLIRYKLQKEGNIEGLKRYEESLENKTKPYFIWELEFAKVFKDNGGFDIVIGNPPYVKEYTNSLIFQPLKNNPYYQGKMDFWYFFACKGIDLLCNKGIECFIAPNNWITNSGASILRNKVLKETKIKEFIDFGNYKVFETAAIQTMVYILIKEKQNKSYEMNYDKLLIENPSAEKLNKFLYSSLDTHEQLSFINKMESSKLYDKYIEFLKPEINSLLNNIKKDAFTLNKNEVAQGIVAPQDFLNKKNAQILGGKHKVGDGVFVITLEELESMKVNENEKDIIKPYYTSNELLKYFINSKNRYYVLYCKHNINSTIDNYPNIKKHLDNYVEIITSDNRPYGLHRARNEFYFEGEKILSLRKCIEPTFTYSDGDCYVSQTYNVIKTDRVNMKFLVALLNSKLIKFWLFYKGKLQGNNYQVDKAPLLEIPIKTPSSNKLGKIEMYLENIRKSIEIRTAISEIDSIIYKVYNLTDDEIGIIEQL